MSSILHYEFPEYIGGYIFPQYIYKYSKLLKNTPKEEHKSIKLVELKILKDGEKKVHGNRCRRRVKEKKVKMISQEEEEYNVQLAIKYDEFYDIFEEDYLNVELMVKYFDDFCELFWLLEIKLKNVIHMIKPQKYLIDSDKNKKVIDKLNITNGIYKYAFIKGNPDENDIIYSLLDNSISEEWLNFGTNNIKLTPLFINKLLGFNFEKELRDYNEKTKDLKEIYNQRIQKAISFLTNNVLNNQKNKSLLLPTNEHNRIYFLTKDNYKHLINCDIFFKNMKKKKFEKINKISESIDFNVVPCIYQIPASIFDMSYESDSYVLNYYDDLDSNDEDNNDNIIYLDENNKYKFNGFTHRNKESFFSRRRSKNDTLVQRKDLYMLESLNILHKNEDDKYVLNENEFYMKNLANIPNIGALYFTHKINLNIIKFLSSIGYIIDDSYMKYFLKSFDIDDYINVNPSYITYLQNKKNSVLIDKVHIECVDKPDYLYYDTESLYDESKIIEVLEELSKYIDIGNDNTLIYYCIIHNLVNTLKYVVEKMKNKNSECESMIDKNILNKKKYSSGTFFNRKKQIQTLFEYVYILNNAHNKNEERLRNYNHKYMDNTYNKVYLNLSTLDYLVTVHDVKLDSSFYKIKNISLIKYLLFKNVPFDNNILVYYLKYNYGLFNYFVKKLHYKLPHIMKKDILKFLNIVKIRNDQINVALVNDIIENQELYGISNEEIKSSFNNNKHLKLFIINFILNGDQVKPYIMRLKYKNIAIYNNFIQHIVKYTENDNELFDSILKKCIKQRNCKIFSLIASHIPNFDINVHQNLVDGIKIHEEVPIRKFYTFSTSSIVNYEPKSMNRSIFDNDSSSSDESEKEYEEELHKYKIQKNIKREDDVYNNDILLYLYDNEFTNKVGEECDNYVLLYNFDNDNIYSSQRYKPNSRLYNDDNTENDIKTKLEELKVRNKKETHTWRRSENIRFENIFDYKSDSDDSTKYKDTNMPFPGMNIESSDSDSSGSNSTDSDSTDSDSY